MSADTEASPVESDQTAPTVEDALSPEAAKEAAPAEHSGLVHIPLPPDGLPVASLDDALTAISGALEVEDVDGGDGGDPLEAVEDLLHEQSLPGLRALDGLVLTSLSFAKTGAFIFSLEWPEKFWEVGHGFSIGAPALCVAHDPDEAHGMTEVMVAGALNYGALTLDASVRVNSSELEVAAEIHNDAPGDGEDGEEGETQLGALLREVGLDGSSLDHLEIEHAALEFSVATGGQSAGDDSAETRLHLEVVVGGSWSPFWDDGPELRGLSMEIGYGPADEPGGGDAEESADDQTDDEPESGHTEASADDPSSDGDAESTPQPAEESGEQLTGKLEAELGLGSYIDLDAAAEYDGVGWDLSVALETGDDFPVINDLTGWLGVDGEIPLIGGMTLQTLEVNAHSETRHFDAALEFGDDDTTLGASIVVENPEPHAHADTTSSATAGTETSAPMAGQAPPAASKRKVRVDAYLKHGDFTLEGVYDKGAGVWIFGLAEAEDESINLSDVLTTLLGTLDVAPPPLPEIDVHVTEIVLASLPAASAAGTSERRSLIFVDLDTGFNVGGLPLVGDIFSGDKKLGVRLGVRYAKAPISKADVKKLNDALPEAFPPLPTGDEGSADDSIAFPATSEGSSPLHVDLFFGDLVIPIPTSGAEAGRALDSAKSAGRSATGAARRAGTEVGRAGDHARSAGRSLSAAADERRNNFKPTKRGPTVPTNPREGDTSKSWIALDTTIGPLALRRIGVGLEGDQKIALVLDGGVAIGPVSAEAMGLGVTYDFEKSRLRPTLDGLAIAFDNGSLAIAGGFLRTPSTDTLNGDLYTGMVRVRASDTQFSALGMYQEVHGGPTFFIYGYLGFSAGLRPLISVEGVALGFGYGRQLITVPASQVSEFPLVAEAVGGPESSESEDDGEDGEDGEGEDGAEEGGGNEALEVLAELAKLGHYLPPKRGGLVFAFGLKAGVLEGLIDAFALATVSISINEPDDLTIQLMGAGTVALPPKMPSGPWVARLELDIAAHIRPMLGELGFGLSIGHGSYVLDPAAALTGDIAVAAWLLGKHQSDFVVTAGGYRSGFRRPEHYPTARRLGLHWHVSDALRVKGELYGALMPHTFMAGGRLEATFEAGKAHAHFALWMDVLIKWKPFHYDFRVHVEVDAGWGPFDFSVSAHLHVWGPKFGGHAEITYETFFHDFSFDVDFGHSVGGVPRLTLPEFISSFLGEPENRLSIAPTAGVHHLPADGAPPSELPVVCAKELELVVTSAMPFSSQPVHVVPMMEDLTTELTVTIKRKRHADASGEHAWGQDLYATFDPVTTTKNFPRALYRKPGEGGSTVALDNGKRLRPPKPAPSSASREINHTAFDWDLVVKPCSGSSGRSEPLVEMSSTADVATEWAPMLADDAVTDSRAGLLDALGVERVGHVIRSTVTATDLTGSPRLHEPARRTEVSP